MSSKLGTILSMLFFAMFFLFGIDLIKLQYSYSELDSKSVDISYLISRNGTIDQSFSNYIESKYQVRFLLQSPQQQIKFGDEVEYILEQTYNPIILSNRPITLSIYRTTVVGFIG